MNEFIGSIRKIILRDLDKLEAEISQYPNDDSLWSVSGDIKNSAGNLCLHLCGNLQHFIGAILGASGYQRDREKEFSLKGLSREKLLAEVRQTKVSVGSALDALDPQVLGMQYPLVVFDEPMTTTYFLIHLATHLDYHLGQINYHRRKLKVKA